MLFLTRLFGVTASDAERNLAREQSDIEEIVAKVLVMQANAAAQQKRQLCRGTHAKGTCVRAIFEVIDVAVGRERGLAARLAQGMFKTPGVYPAVVRFANADPTIRSDIKADVRSLSFAVDLTRNGTSVPEANGGRQDFSLQNAKVLPINDARAFLAMMKVLTASSQVAAFWALPFSDKLRVLRTTVLAQSQAHQKVKPYQHLRYWSTVPFHHGPDVVKYSATPAADNTAWPLERGSPDALQNELLRHVDEDRAMSSFEVGVQLCAPDKMTYWGKRRDAAFWAENASVAWNEREAPFHKVGRLTLLPRSQLSRDAAEAAYFDVTGNALPDSFPLGSINRARWRAEFASRQARTCPAVPKCPVSVPSDQADAACLAEGPGRS